MNINKYWLFHAAYYIVATVFIYSLFQWTLRLFPAFEYSEIRSFFEIRPFLQMLGTLILLFIGMVLPTFPVNQRFFDDHGRSINTSEEKILVSRTVSALFVISFVLVIITDRLNATPLRGSFGLLNLHLLGIVLIILFILSTAAYFTIRAIYRQGGTNKALTDSAHSVGKYMLADLTAVASLTSAIHSLKSYIYMRRILVITLIIFFVIFGIPLIGIGSTNQMVVFFGCETGYFDRAAACPRGEGLWGLGGRFSRMALSGPAVIILFIFQPMLLALAFWDILLVWILAIIILSVMISKMRKKA